MKCRQARFRMTDFLDVSHDEDSFQELQRHLEECPDCSREFEALRKTFEAVGPKHRVSASPDFKERVMNAISTLPREARSAGLEDVRRTFWKPSWAFAAVVVLVLGVTLWTRPRGPNEPSSTAGFALLQQAFASEADLFSGKGIVHLTNEIEVKPTADEALASARWIPTCSVKADGSLRFDQLRLPAQTGQGYTLTDEAWYDTATGCFARVLRDEGKPIFANAYDGAFVYSLEAGPNGDLSVVKTPIANGFLAPKNPAEFLGIAAGFPSGIDEKDKSLVQEAGEGALKDGSEVRILRVGIQGTDSYWNFKVRKDDNTIAEMEWLAGEEPLLAVRRVLTETVEAPGVSWNLAEIEDRVAGSEEASKPGITPDIVVPNVTLRHMVEKADFETYIFNPNPSWTNTREIVDILDLPSPPHRMFCIAYRADDGRHVVLVQSYSYNAMLGPLAKQGTVKYESPNGFKVWSGPKDKWGAQIALQSARAFIKDPPSEDRTGYFLESPAGTFPALAVNGQMSDEELHSLVDSLVPAREIQDDKVGESTENGRVMNGVSAGQLVALTAHSLLAETLDAMSRLRSVHVKNDLGGEMAEAWAEFDKDGGLRHLRMEFPVTLDGPKTVIWQDDKAEIFFKEKNSLLLVRDTETLASFPKDFFDPQQIVKDLYQEEKDGKVAIEAEEPVDAGESVVLKVTRQERPGFQWLYQVDPQTKLLEQMMTCRIENGEPRLIGRVTYLDYNEPIDPAVFDLDLPEDVIRADQATQAVGLPKGDLTDEEITVQLVREFFEALMAKNYSRAGQIYSGLSAEEMEKLFGDRNVTRIVSIGKPKPHWIPGVGGYVVDCEVEIEKEGVKSAWKCSPAVRPVHGQPDRWNIFGGI